ncbi:unnamed protein product [Closterium sp. Naga37s-1]|nr:unnamed protein product [Closterium sp. Naga37s-1]
MPSLASRARSAPPPRVRCAVGGAQASATLLPPCPFSGDAPLANGTRCCPSSLPALAAPARASRCCAPLAGSRAAPATTAPPGLSSLGARMSLESAAHPPTNSRAPAAAPASARRRHSNLPALPVGRAPGNPPPRPSPCRCSPSGAWNRSALSPPRCLCLPVSRSLSSWAIRSC